MNLKSPAEQLNDDERDDLLSYLLETNDARDIAEMLLELMNCEQLSELVVEVKQANEQSGDYPHIQILELE